MKSKELGKERIGSKRIVNKDGLDEASESIKEISIVRSLTLFNGIIKKGPPGQVATH